jgi:hypothetical protein
MIYDNNCTSKAGVSVMNHAACKKPECAGKESAPIPIMPRVYVPIRVNAHLHSLMHQFASENQVSILAIFQLAIGIASRRYVQLGSITTVVSGRSMEERTQFSIGPFAEPVATLIPHDPNMSIREHIQDLHCSFSKHHSVHDNSIGLFHPFMAASDNGDAREIIICLSYIIDEYWTFPDMEAAISLLDTLTDGIGQFALWFELYERRTLQGTLQGIEGRVLHNASVIEKEDVKDLLVASEKIIQNIIDYPDMKLGDFMRLLSNFSAQSRSGGGMSGILRKYVAPLNPCQSRIAKICEDVLRQPRIGILDRFEEFNITQMDRDRICRVIKNAYGVDVSSSICNKDASIEMIGAYIADTIPIAPIIEHNNNGTDIPILYLHGDILGRGVYTNELAKILANHHPLYIMPPHGINGENVLASIEQMALENCQKVLQYGKSAYIVGGYCNGALVGYEMARLMQGSGIHVPLLIMIEPPALDLSNCTPSVLRTSGRDREIHSKQIELIADELAWKCFAFSPAKYTGQVLIIRAKKSPWRGMDECWALHAPNMKCVVSDGDHISCLGRYIEAICNIITNELS